jgi:ketosteroid isomerase-like protein
MRACLFVLVTGILAVGCGSASRSGEQVFGKAEAEALRQRSRSLTEAFNKKEVESLVGFYQGEAVVYPPNAPTVRGREAIGDFFKELYAQGATDLQAQTADLGGHGPIAYETGTFALQMRPAEGTGTRDRGKYVFVWRNNNNVWQIQYAMWSSDLPEPVTLAAAR